MIQEETIEKGSTGFWGRFDCEDRSEMALEKFPQFFKDPAHIAKTEQVLGIIDAFFKVKKNVFINHRIGTNKSGPFTAVKVSEPVFPNQLKQTEKEDLFYKPLEALGVKLVFNKGTNSYLVHVR